MRLDPKKNWISNLLTRVTGIDCNVTMYSEVYWFIMVALDYCDDGYGDTVIKRFKNGFSVKEIAKTENVTTSTIYRHLNCAYKGFIDDFNEGFIGQEDDPLNLIVTNVLGLYTDINMTEFITDKGTLKCFEDQDVTTVEDYANSIQSFNWQIRLYVGLTFYDFIKGKFNRKTKEEIANEIKSEEELD